MQLITSQQPVRMEKGGSRHTRPRYYMMIEWSEAATHLKVAGTMMGVELDGPRSVQLFKTDGTMFSFPILTGEAGVYQDDKGFYFYPPETFGLSPNDRCYAIWLNAIKPQNKVYQVLCAHAAASGWNIRKEGKIYRVHDGKVEKTFFTVPEIMMHAQGVFTVDVTLFR